MSENSGQGGISLVKIFTYSIIVFLMDALE